MAHAGAEGFGPFGHGHGDGGSEPGLGPGPRGWHGGRRSRGSRGRGGRRRRRVSRGEVRTAILAVLAEEPMHGYQIMQELEERSGGGWQPSPGSIYPTLQLLADEGLIASRPEGGKNIFSLTDEGRTAADDIDGPPVWERFGGEGASNLVNLRHSIFQLGAAAKQVASTGTDRQVEAAEKILNDARKALYKLLAEDDEG